MDGLFLAAWLLAFPLAGADEVYLSNGSMFSGTIVHEDNRMLVLDIGAGKLTFDKSEIVRVVRDGKPSSGTEPGAPSEGAPGDPTGPDKPAVRVPAPVVRPSDVLEPGMLAAGAVRPVSLPALAALPDAFLGGTYSAVARIEGIERDEGWRGSFLVLSQGGVRCGGRPRPGALHFAASLDRLEGLEAGSWVLLTFDLGRVERDHPDFGATLYYRAVIYEIEPAEAFVPLQEIFADPRRWAGGSVRTWIAAEDVGEAVEGPGDLVELMLPGRGDSRPEVVLAAGPDVVEIAALHRAPFPAEVVVESERLVRVASASPLYPYSHPEAAMALCRFVSGARYGYAWSLGTATSPDIAHPNTLESEIADVGESLILLAEVPAWRYDLRYPAQITILSGHDAGERVVEEHGEFETGFAYFHRGRMVQASSLDALRALDDLPEQIFERSLKLTASSSGPGTIGGRETIVRCDVYSPIFRCLVLDGARRDWVAVETGPTTQRAQDALTVLSHLAELLWRNQLDTPGLERDLELHRKDGDEERIRRDEARLEELRRVRGASERRFREYREVLHRLLGGMDRAPAGAEAGRPDPLRIPDLHRRIYEARDARDRKVTEIGHLEENVAFYDDLIDPSRRKTRERSPGGKALPSVPRAEHEDPSDRAREEEKKEYYRGERDSKERELVAARSALAELEEKLADLVREYKMLNRALDDRILGEEVR
ncbi:MAG: hypothetical protein HY720_06230 [Planctomycetes bacterium]|nr:hypothetical protein [Planctomycetota bacterium]